MNNVFIVGVVGFFILCGLVFSLFLGKGPVSRLASSLVAPFLTKMSTDDLLVMNDRFRFWWERPMFVADAAEKILRQRVRSLSDEELVAMLNEAPAEYEKSRLLRDPEVGAKAYRRARLAAWELRRRALAWRQSTDPVLQIRGELLRAYLEDMFWWDSPVG